MQGWIKLHRCLLDKAIWQGCSPEQKTILITLLMMANHKEKEWLWNGKEFKARPGQFVTSLESIATKAGRGISIKNVRSAIDKFQKLGFLANESAKTGRLITIVKWEDYQHDENLVAKEPADRWQTGGKQVATNKNDKNDKNDKKKRSSSENYFSDDALEMKMTNYMIKMVKESYPGAVVPNTPAKKNNWCITFDRMMRIDGRTKDEIGKVMKWVYQDDFWSTNIRSPEKLREKWDTVYLQMKRDSKKTGDEPKLKPGQRPGESDAAYIKRIREEEDESN